MNLNKTWETRAGIVNMKVLNILVSVNLGYIIYWKLTNLLEVEKFGDTTDLTKLRDVTSIFSVLEACFMLLSFQYNGFYSELLLVDFCKLLILCLSVLQLLDLYHKLNFQMINHELGDSIQHNTIEVLLVFQVQKILVVQTLWISILSLLHTILQMVQTSLSKYNQKNINLAQKSASEMPNQKYMVV
eukprot:snap_masked-scaffold_36-processed-gene-2.51-mRNA-1 protein AED:1.00 eAED:1.00 QI:0/-1/0/0/-1/1/1/0/186